MNKPEKIQKLINDFIQVHGLSCSSPHFPEKRQEETEPRWNYLLCNNDAIGSVDYFPKSNKFTVNTYEADIYKETGEVLQSLLDQIWSTEIPERYDL